MKYARFERIVILLIAIAIAVMTAAMVMQKTDAIEIYGHVMMLTVIIASLYWGKRGAVISFLFCFSSYTVLRLIWSEDFGYGTSIQLIIAKFLVYGILALLCSRMRTQFRYFFVKLEHQDYIDDETQIGNERFLRKELTARISENERYDIPFSVIDFSLDDGFVSGLRERGVRVLRDLSASVLKSDTRSVDELARNHNELLVILPSVGRDGAQVCGKRLEAKVVKYLEQYLDGGDLEDILDLAIYEYPEDKAAVKAILDRVEAG